MFKSIFNKIADSSKASPSRSAGGDDLNSPDEFQTPEAAEGFLCPTCMLGFPSAEVLQDHYDTSHATNDSGDSHICSACKMKLGTARELESHFARHHVPLKSTDVEENELLSNSTLRQEMDDLHVSLKEERWYTDELKKEIERLQSSVEFGQGNSSSRTEADMFYQNQIKVLEESKSLALNEVVLLKEHLADSREELSRLRLEKDKLEQRTASVASELANIKAKHDEVTSEKFDLSQKLRDSQDEVNSLQIEVQQRIGAEDALLLRQELVNVQRAMDELTLAKEKEKEHLKQSCQKLESEKEDLKNALSCAPDLAELERLRGQVSELNKSVKELKDEKLKMHDTFEERFEEYQSSSSKELAAEKEKSLKLEKQIASIEGALEESHNTFKKFKEDSGKQVNQLQLEAKQNIQEHSQKVALLQSDSDKLKRQLEEKDILVLDIKAKSERLELQCQENQSLIDKYKDEISEKSSFLEESNRLTIENQNKISQMESEFNSLQEQLQRLEAERTDLYAKIESGDGAKTAIAQLQQENGVLQEQVKKLQDSILEVQKETKAKIDDASAVLKQQKDKTLAKEKDLNKVSSCLTQLQEEMKELNNKCSRLESEITKKEKQISEVETSKASEKLELEKLLTVDRQKLIEITEKSTETQNKLDEITNELMAEQKSSQDFKQKLQKLQAKCAENEKQLTVANQKETSLLNQISDFKKALDSAKSKTSKLESTCKKYEEELKSKEVLMKEALMLTQKLEGNKKVIESSIEELKNENATLKESVDFKEKELINRAKIISESGEEIIELKKQMEDDAAEYHKLINDKNELEAKVKEYEGQVEGRDALIKTLKEEIEESKEVLTKFQHTENQHTREIQQQKDSFTTMTKDLNEAREKVSVLENGCKKLREQMTVTENELDSSRVTCKGFELKCDNLEDELKDRDFRLRQETESLSKAEEAKVLLIDQKLKLQSELEGATKQIEKEIGNRKALFNEFASKEKEMEDNLQKLNQQIENQRAKNKETQRMWDDARSQLEGQASVLQENLSTLRQDLAAEKSRTSNLETKVDELGGQKLELEAKLENALDERRALLDRCLRSEDECEKLRGSTAELRRKLDDTLAALHELGRENQSLQIENTKLVQRKWAEDGEVTHCTACRKQFTVTIRKHHCRSCGSIFCNECSAKTATIASYKKAVRVCDSCHEEVGQ